MSAVKECLKEAALREGFSDIAFTSTEQSPPRQQEFRRWLDGGFHGDMHWLEKHYALRQDAKNLFPESRSLMVAAIPYELKKNFHPDRAKIASYARYEDYHRHIRNKLQKVLKYCQKRFPELKGRAISDSAPLDETAYAEKAGLGFIGKNNLLIHPKLGSSLLLGELLINTEIENDSPLIKDCGKCRKCVDACPTGALSAYNLDARLCISYLSVEQKKKGDDNIDRKGWVFGCDLCLLACPYNKREDGQRNFILPKASYEDEDLQWNEINNLNKNKFNKLFGNSPVKRRGLDSFQESVEIALRQSNIKIDALD